MTAFEHGIIKYASECRLSDTKIAYILKRALEHPESKRILKSSPTSDDTVDDTDHLSHLLAQYEIDHKVKEYLAEHLSGKTNKISLS